MAEVEGPPLPTLTRAQVATLLSYDDRLRRLTAGKLVTLAALERFGLVWRVPPATGVYAQWVPTEAGHRVLRLLRRARAAA